MRTLRRLFTIIALLALGACGGPLVRINPPSASVQSLALRGDDRVAVVLRVQNFSTVAMRFDAIEATLAVDGATLATLSHRGALEVPPQSADVLALEARVDAATATKLRAARELAYALDGTIEAGAPDRDRWPFEYDSRLAPVPGRPGEFR